jgi:hypothetical protein
MNRNRPIRSADGLSWADSCRVVVPMVCNGPIRSTDGSERADPYSIHRSLTPDEEGGGKAGTELFFKSGHTG